MSTEAVKTFLSGPIFPKLSQTWLAAPQPYAPGRLPPVEAVPPQSPRCPFGARAMAAAAGTNRRAGGIQTAPSRRASRERPAPGPPLALLSTAVSLLAKLPFRPAPVSDRCRQPGLEACGVPARGSFRLAVRPWRCCCTSCGACWSTWAGRPSRWEPGGEGECCPGEKGGRACPGRRHRCVSWGPICRCGAAWEFPGSAVCIRCFADRPPSWKPACWAEAVWSERASPQRSRREGVSSSCVRHYGGTRPRYACVDSLLRGFPESPTDAFGY